jgi:hypothetical protein
MNSVGPILAQTDPRQEKRARARTRMKLSHGAPWVFE